MDKKLIRRVLKLDGTKKTLRILMKSGLWPGMSMRAKLEALLHAMQPYIQ